MEAPSLLILAAGMGSRYGGLKQLDPMGPSGETLLEYSVYDALRAGFGRIVFVIRRDIEAPFREQVLSRFEGKVPYALAFQEMDALPAGFEVPQGRSKPWGTGHAVLCARSVIDGAFGMINADDYYGPGALRTLCDYLQRPAPETGPARYCLVGYRLDRTLSEHGTVSRGVCEVNAQQQLLAVTERTAISRQPEGPVYADEDGELHPLAPSTIVSMNCFGFQQDLFTHLEMQFTDFLRERGTEAKSEFYIPAAIATMIHRGQVVVDVLTTDESWMGVTYAADKPACSARIAERVEAGIYPASLWSA